MNHQPQRRTLLKGTIAGVAGVAGIAGGGATYAFLQTNAAHASPADNREDKAKAIKNILNIAATAEALGIVFYTQVLQHADRLELNDVARRDFKAAQIEEVLHLQFLLKQGAKLLTNTFSFPNSEETFMRFENMIKVQQLLETAFTAAYMAAAKEFAMLGRPDLVLIATQIGTVEAEHRAVGRCVGKMTPANNQAFSPALLKRVADAPMFLKNNGFLTPKKGNSYMHHWPSMQGDEVGMRNPS